MVLAGQLVLVEHSPLDLLQQHLDAGILYYAGTPLGQLVQVEHST